MKDLDARIQLRLLEDRVKESETIIRQLLKELHLIISTCEGLHLEKKEDLK